MPNLSVYQVKPVANAPLFFVDTDEDAARAQYKRRFGGPGSRPLFSVTLDEKTSAVLWEADDAGCDLDIDERTGLVLAMLPRGHRLDSPLATSDSGLLDDDERLNAPDGPLEIGEKISPIPCKCIWGHAWWAPGYMQIGVGTVYDNGDDRWCYYCAAPDEHCSSLGDRPWRIDSSKHTGWPVQDDPTEEEEQPG